MTAADLNTNLRDNFRALEPFFLKTTPKVVSTTGETDLFNGECTITSGRIGTAGGMLIRAQGDWVQNSGAGTASPRFKVKFGSGPTTVIDTGATGGTSWTNSATRFGWWLELFWDAAGATNSQWLTMTGVVTCAAGGASGAGGTWTTGTGVTMLEGGSGMYDGGIATAIDTTISELLQLTVITPSSTSTDVTLKSARGWFTG